MVVGEGRCPRTGSGEFGYHVGTETTYGGEQGVEQSGREEGADDGRGCEGGGGEGISVLWYKADCTHGSGRGRCLCSEGEACRRGPPGSHCESAPSKAAESGWEGGRLGAEENDDGGLLPVRVSGPLEERMP